jgi:hypothetical protein
VSGVKLRHRSDLELNSPANNRHTRRFFHKLK